MSAPPNATPEAAATRDASAHEAEVRGGERFRFGRNWQRFLSILDDQRIAMAEQSLREGLGVDTLAGRTFLDIGSGSGLFSLAARRLGARVHAFDFDPESVACTRELRRRYFPDDPDWVVEQGSALDAAYLARLPRCDVVYSWGVLHHTGAMWQALEHAGGRVAPRGLLFLAIYNDQGLRSRLALAMKRAYVKSPRPGKWLIAGLYVGSQLLQKLVKDLLALRNPLRRYRRVKTRGMSSFYDWIDWVGGYPFEVATPDEVFDFFHRRGFELVRLGTVGAGHGCNEFVFVRKPEAG